MAGAFLVSDFEVAGHDTPRVFAGFALLQRSDPLQETKNSVSLQLFCD